MLVISISKHFRIGFYKESYNRAIGVNLGFISVYFSKMDFEDYTEDVKMDWY